MDAASVAQGDDQACRLLEISYGGPDERRLRKRMAPTGILVPIEHVALVTVLGPDTVDFNGCGSMKGSNGSSGVLMPFGHND